MLNICKILCPIDYSAPSLAALNVALQWAQHFNAELMVLHVISDYPPDAIDVPLGVPSADLYATERREAAEAELKNYLAWHVPAGVYVEGEIRMGHTAKEITRLAHEEGVDLIILSTHGHTAWRHAIFGSVAEAVMRTAPCKVVTIGPDCQESKCTKCTNPHKNEDVFIEASAPS